MKRQIKTSLSRILCIALILCMMLALIPAAFAATKEEETKDFSIDFHTFAKSNANANATTATYAATGFWAWESVTGSVAGEFKSSYGLRVKSDDAGAYGAVKFTAPATGTYNINYGYFQAFSSAGNPNGGMGNVFIIEYNHETVGADVTGIISNTEAAYFTGIDYATTEENKSPDCDSEKEITLIYGKEYLIVFACTGNGTGSSSFNMYARSLTFTDARWNDVKAVYNFAQADYAEGVTCRTISYTNSENRVEFDKTNASGQEYGWNRAQAVFGLENENQYASYKIRIPVAGLYNFTFNHAIGKNGGIGDLYIIPGDIEFEDWFTADNLVIDNIDFYNESNVNETSTPETGIFYAPSAGEYYFVLKRDESGTRNFVWASKLTLNGSKDSSATAGAPVAGINIGKTVFEEKETATIEITANNSADGAVLTPDVKNLESLDDEVISINGNTITAEGPGVATITADINGYPASVTLTVNDAEMTEAFSDVSKIEAYEEIPSNKAVKVLKYYTDGKEPEYADDIQVKYNQQTVLDLETIGTPEGYTFLYWAKGATDSKQIIPGETCTIYPTVETTYMIAVYAPTGAAAEDKVEFYNYNGQLLDATIEGGKMPALPSMTGYGKADHWALYGSTDTYKGGDVAPETSGTAIFVAQYKDLEENITVTAENCTVNDGSSATVKYGDTVECVADGEGEFKWWTKTVNGKDEIVSLDEDYTFKAWESCKVTAVYGDKAPTYVGDTMRIIIDELTVEETNDKAYMAEFVGLDRAVEKGIMLGSKKIAMSSKDNQFTIINDEGVEAANIKGYAILANGTLITDK